MSTTHACRDVPASGHAGVRADAAAKKTAHHPRAPDARPCAGRERGAGNAAVNAACRPQADARRALDHEDELFGALLGGAVDDRRAPLLMAPLQMPDAGTAGEAQAGGGASAMLIWLTLEPELARPLAAAPADGMAMTLLLPKLGAVDARFAPLKPDGWDIALRFNPDVWSSLAQHRERCRHALRQRLACRVRLSFARRDTDV
ncbi:type III secretion system HrpP C-terminal domain-containing protein [Acerihabitans arboris]|uniref:Flagellar hook-length control protein-like C-terminal domain-containing protein n=1 Tax=Acerihabitans arboris TaxID=2691583 RepID=A0A845SQG1_9GAMM|nr:type III secretion system HrpP C-terminal domain-containing protein [Acerihabitans arboris]NDL63385.1 hypothetical protein [Acerihabitans arboris]